MEPLSDALLRDPAPLMDIAKPAPRSFVPQTPEQIAESDARYREHLRRRRVK